MPLLDFFSSGNAHIGLWKITEPEEELLSLANNEQLVQEARQFSNENRRREFLASRLLVSQMLQESRFPAELPAKDDFGKPYLAGCPHSLSLSHTTEMAAAILSGAPVTGIDLEPVRPAILKLTPKFLSHNELDHVQTDPLLATLYWSIKETVYKLYGKRKLQFNEHMQVEAFRADLKGGTAFATLYLNGEEEVYPVQYQIRNELVLTWCSPETENPH